MKIESKLILTSKNAVTGVNLYTFVLTYPRMILAEVNTHRMLSRNAASSRAIPAKKQRKQVLADPFVPSYVGQNQKGMQAGEELKGWKRFVVENTWRITRYPNVLASWILDKMGAHKQAANRIIEPWTYTQQIVTCTDLKNFFKLRNHPDAEPHFQIIAKQMQAQVEYVERLFETVNFDSRNPDGSACALDNVNPKLGVYRVQMLRPGWWGAGEQDWHLPFIDQKDIWRVGGLIAQYQHWEWQQRMGIPSYSSDPTPPIYIGVAAWEALKQISTARCARVSYLLPENGERSDAKRDIELCGRLSGSGHWSPFEHVATPVETADYIGNFRSWKQYRKEFSQEDGGDR
jgi:thymidylate synthase ThyX